MRWDSEGGLWCGHKRAAGSLSINPDPTLSTSGGRLTRTDPIRMVTLNRTTRTGLTRTAIRSRTSLTRTLTPGPTRLTPMTGTVIEPDLATVDYASGLGCDSSAGDNLDTA